MGFSITRMVHRLALLTYIWHMQGIDGLILVAPAIVAPIFRASRAASNSGRCQRDGNAMSASFEGPEMAQGSKKR